MIYQIRSTFNRGNVEALSTMKHLHGLEGYNEIIFNLNNYNDCNPFNNLVIAKTLRDYSLNHPASKCALKRCAKDNTDSFLQHIGFYDMIGVPYGKKVGEARPNENYVPITKLTFEKNFYDSIESYAQTLANTLSFNPDLHVFASYIFVELIRNIYEHSRSNDAYICAQKWEPLNLVEIAILDSGCGISNALKRIYRNKDESELLRMATDPGISAKSNHALLDKKDGWRNSGYGLYAIKKLAIEYGGSLMVCSNNYCDYYVRNGTIAHYETYFPGTALAIRFRTDTSVNFIEARRRIIKEGELEAKQNNRYETIKSASKSSSGFYTTSRK